VASPVPPQRRPTVAGQVPVTPTHSEVLAAIDKARLTDVVGHLLHRRAGLQVHCDDLRAIAERHAPGPRWKGSEQVHCIFCACRCHSHSGIYCNQPFDGEWPCPDYQQVIDRLTGWGVL